MTIPKHIFHIVLDLETISSGFGIVAYHLFQIHYGQHFVTGIEGALYQSIPFLQAAEGDFHNCSKAGEIKGNLRRTGSVL